MASGAWVMRDKYYGARLILTLSRGSGSTVNYTLKYECTASMYGTWTAKLSGGVTRSVSYTINKSYEFVQTIATGSYSNSKAHSVSATAQTPWGAVPKVTASIKASVTAPAAPSGFSFTRTSDTGLSISFKKGARADSTRFTSSKNSAAWYNRTLPTGSSTTLTNNTVDSYWRFKAYSKNAAGNSSSAGPYVIYTRPATPSKPTLGSSKKVSWSNKGRYTHGVQIQRTDDNGSTTTTTTLGKVTTWTDPTAQKITTKYRVRTWAGPSVDESRTYSNWSSWSVEAKGILYNPPSLRSVSIERSTGADPNPMGTEALVKFSGRITSSSIVPGNVWKLEYRYMSVGGSYTAWTTYLQAQTTESFSETFTFGGSTLDVKKSYIVQFRISDSMESATYTEELPTGSVAFSIGKDGAGVGKIFEPAGQTLQVGGGAQFDGNAYGVFDAPFAYSDDFAPGVGGYEHAWSLGSACYIGTSTSDPTGYFIGIDPQGTSVAQRSAYGPMLRVIPGQVIQVNLVKTYDGTGDNSRFNIRFYFYDATGVEISNKLVYDSNNDGDGNWSSRTIKEKVVVPDEAYRGRLRLYAYDAVTTRMVGFRHFDVRVDWSNSLLIDGRVYQRSGTKTFTNVAVTSAAGSNYVSDVKTVSTGQTPPDGWAYMLQGTTTLANGFFSQRTRTTANPTFRMMAAQSYTMSTVYVMWTLVKNS